MTQDMKQPDANAGRTAGAPAVLWLCALLGALSGWAQAQTGTANSPQGAAAPVAYSTPQSPADRPSRAAGQPQPAAVQTTGAASALPPASATPHHEALFAQARQWVMDREQLPLDQVRFAPLDSRVRIAPCHEALQFDYPFTSSRETVRVRCSQPTAWQLFLRLSNPAPIARPTTAPPSTAVRATAPVNLQPPTKTVVVARRLLQRGTELDASMLEEVQKPVLGLDPLAIASVKDIGRAEVVRDISAGTVLRGYDIKRSLMVRKGQAATLTVGQRGNFQITVQVEAQQDGHLGEQIRLKNPESGRLISGVVTGPNTLRGL